MRRGLSTVRGVVPVAVALTLLAALVALDFLPPAGEWYADHPMTGAAISSVVVFIAAGLLIESWLREREAGRLDRISTVAYRSLAQYANDAGRSLLAPLTGADLHALAIPGAAPGDARSARERLTRRGHAPSFGETTGSWRGTTEDRLDPVLRDLVADAGFVREMFRTTATMRRRLQEVTALWAPVMLVSRASADDLGRLRDLTDALELLQEQWRRSGIVADDGAVWSPDPTWVDDVSEQFWRAIATYEAIRDDFGDRAKLPSDAIVRRRPERHERSA